MQSENTEKHSVTKSDVENNEIIEIIDKVEKMPPEQKEQAMLTLEMHYGPIPHPEILKKYDELDPGAAKLIIENGVNESVHRRDMEKRLLEKEINDKRRGQYLGFIIGLVVILAGTYLIYANHPITGTLLSGTSLLGLVGSFLSSGSNDRNNEKSNESE
ncbi:hypothetical protein CIRMBP1229_02401 [Enterococcus cecorum]|uniref:DUF2335 domain-containing protein n=1 Tax=Enterococcus cecorum TaxID=44008 RepID=UPI0022D79DD6|nr:DUF2335 domain-containing protein [Enterococcus cecorum]CAI3328446.1 hypothetical protein CIRMBP1228_00961 [Enterococcus cecorum]CAI3467830.1 hypothetical protein CIRMBP1216_02165 [Enterococcus cecorum]CAI3473075.1 hypothetical protein CIRMBP1218_02153 [Enterococcus cecorum]CAI3474444.1 hypothetical protein CIRMBP1211_02213 [Enterococcus cecorum]CAI3475284.1 hypothetical protein CIRMBP1260_02225 [Enterococcus cecorum]